FLAFSCVATCSSVVSLSLHDALPISLVDVALDDLPLELEGLLRKLEQVVELGEQALLVTGEAEAQARAIDRHDAERAGLLGRAEDRKSTRLNSSHVKISYAVFCLKKK